MYQMATPKGQRKKTAKKGGIKGIYLILLLVSVVVYFFFKETGIDPFDPFNRSLALIMYLGGFFFLISIMGIVFDR